MNISMQRRIVGVAAVFFLLGFLLSSCRTAHSSSEVRDLADPGSPGVTSRYFQIGPNNRVVMSDCATDQVPSPKCSVNPVKAPYAAFAKLCRDGLIPDEEEAKKNVQQIEAGLRVNQAVAAKQQMDQAQSALDAVNVTLADHDRKIEAKRVAVKSLGAKTADYQSVIADIQSRLAKATGADAERLANLLKLNQQEMVAARDEINLRSAEATILERERGVFATNSVDPAKSLLKQTTSAYREKFDGQVDPTPELVAARTRVDLLAETRMGLESSLKLLIETGIPNRVDQMPPSQQAVVRTIFPKNVQLANGQMKFGLYPADEFTCFGAKGRVSDTNPVQLWIEHRENDGKKFSDKFSASFETRSKPSQCRVSYTASLSKGPLEVYRQEACDGYKGTEDLGFTSVSGTYPTARSYCPRCGTNDKCYEGGSGRCYREVIYKATVSGPDLCFSSM
ncbi:MAG: hypothetical protein NTV34_13790 [Proteobacteria bacterium]|nr:hypothetical protein [Pseudomonadota bacterium]